MNITSNMYSRNSIPTLNIIQNQSFNGLRNNRNINKMIKDIAKEDKNMDNSEFFGFDKENFASDLEVLNKRIVYLPTSIVFIMRDIATYAKKHTTLAAFTQDFPDRAKNLSERLTFGVNKEDFAQNYAPEILMVKAVMKSYNALKSNNIDKVSFDKDIASAIESYVKTDIKRETYYAS